MKAALPVFLVPAVRRHHTTLLAFLACAVLLLACGSAVPAPLPALRLSVAAGLPPAAVQAAEDALAATPAEIVPVGAPTDLLLRRAGIADASQPDLAAGQITSSLLYERILVPVDRFSTLLQNVSFAALGQAWRGEAASPDFSTIYPAAECLPDLTAILGEPGPDVKPEPAAGVADSLWRDPAGLGVLPFDDLGLRVHALRLDGASALDNRFAAERWPLAGRAWLSAESARGLVALTRLAPSGRLTNRDPQRLTVLDMTGTTALTRGTAAAMEREADITFPARVVGPALAAADITTISNEVPFVAGCVADNRRGVSLFCARPAYFAALELSGIKLAGLTGNHLNDFGHANLLQTLDLYRAKGVRYYGGGANAAEASAPLLVEHHGNRLVFLGANQFGPAELVSQDGTRVSAWAGPDTPGAAKYDADSLAAAVAGAAASADVVFAELQWLETNQNGDYQAEPVLGQAQGFRALSDAGADVVTGMQAHAPQIIELRNQDRRLILYGLGNLYFDQTFSFATRTGLVARHTIYDHHLINTELLVVYIQDNLQVRWATDAERAQVLRSIYLAGGW